MKLLTIILGMFVLISTANAQTLLDTQVMQANQEWQAFTLQFKHVEEKLNTVVNGYVQQSAAYEARLATAMEWLKQAQDEVVSAKTK